MADLTPAEDDAGKGARTSADDRPRDRRNLLLLAVLWLAAVLLVDPRGEFPTTDDWAYAGSVRALVDQGRLVFSDWGAANFLAHILWGALFAWPLGTSYFALRLSTLVAALLGATALYRLLRLGGAAPGIALLGAAVFLFNPLCMALSFGFMSDMGFVAALLWAMLLLAAGARTGRLSQRAGGWALGLTALLSRQTAIAIPLGWALGRWLVRPVTAPARLLRLALPTAAFGLVQLGFERWLRLTGRMPHFYGRQTSGIVARAIDHPGAFAGWALKLLPQCFYYLGALTLPLTLALAASWLAGLPSARRRPVIGGLAAAFVLLLVYVERQGVRFPTWNNSIWRGGLGADLAGPPAPEWFAATLTWATLAGGLLVVGMVALGVEALWRRRGTGEAIGLPAAAAGTAATLVALTMVVEIRFDRYLIPILPLVILFIAVAPAASRVPSAGAIRFGAIATAAMAVLSVCGAHDMMEAKRVQQFAYGRTVARIAPERVDAGWVLNALTSFGRYGRLDTPDSWHLREEFRVGPVLYPDPAFRVVARYPVDRWLPWARGAMPIDIRQRRAPERPPERKPG